MRRRFLDSPAAPIALLALFAALVALTIMRFSAWIDESATLVFVGDNSYADVLRYGQLDAHPPGWYLLLKPFVDAFGEHVIVSRLHAAACMIGALGVWYHFIRTRFSRPLALLALALMATNPMLLHYAVEGRMYACGILLTGVSCVLVTSTWRHRWIAYWFVAVAMLWIHYFLAFVVAAQFLYLLFKREQSFRFLAIYGASIISAFAPWLPIAAQSTSATVHRGFWIPPVTPNTVPAYVLHAFLHRLDADLKNAQAFLGIAYLAAWGVALFRARRASSTRLGPYVLLWWLVGLPPLLLFALSMKPFVPIFHPRYVIFGLPALIVLLAAGARAIASPRWGAAVVAVLLIGHGFGIQMLRERGFNDTRGYYSMKSVAKELAKPVDGERPIVIASWVFPFFDARVTLPPGQRVVHYRQWAPTRGEFPDNMYQAGWWTPSLDWVHTKHAWLVGNMLEPEVAVPPTWHNVVTHVRGYVRFTLFSIDTPAR